MASLLRLPLLRPSSVSPLLKSQFLRNCSRPYATSNKKVGGYVDDDSPLVYTQTDAHKKYSVAEQFRETDFYEYTPKSQRAVVIASVSAFLIYFCILREENDIDENMYKPLVAHIPGKEASILEAAIAEHKRQGLPTSDMEKRLAQVKHEEMVRTIVMKNSNSQ